MVDRLVIPCSIASGIDAMLLSNSSKSSIYYIIKLVFLQRKLELTMSRHFKLPQQVTNATTVCGMLIIQDMHAWFSFMIGSVN